jgi:hypothetical protein
MNFSYKKTTKARPKPGLTLPEAGIIADFSRFNAEKADLVAAGVRIFGPGATVAQDLEPEDITVSADSSTAWVSLPENNAILSILKLPLSQTLCRQVSKIIH